MGNALFADGAGALVLGAARESPQPIWHLASVGSGLFPDSEEAMTWRIGDHGFEMTLSRQVPETLLKHLKPWLREWLAKLGHRLNAVRSWAVHPGGPRILGVVAESLALPKLLT